MNVYNLEMETSCLFTLANYRGFRAGTVCAIYANRHENKFVDEEMKDEAEKRCIEAGLGAVKILAEMDSKRGDAPNWLPSMSL